MRETIGAESAKPGKSVSVPPTSDPSASKWSTDIGGSASVMRTNPFVCVSVRFRASSDCAPTVSPSIVAISSIHLLRAFMDARETPNDKLMWYVIIHLTFVMSALLMGVLDRIAFASHRTHKAEGSHT